MPTTKKPTTKKRPARATALEVHRGDGTHFVHVGNLRVLIYPEGEGVWIAQGLELDYTAEGKDVKDVQRVFEEGLASSLHANIRVFSHIANFLRPAPAEVWQRLLLRTDCSKHRFSLVSVSNTSPELPMPFAGIDYYVPAESRAI